MHWMLADYKEDPGDCGIRERFSAADDSWCRYNGRFRAGGIPAEETGWIKIEQWQISSCSAGSINSLRSIGQVPGWELGETRYGGRWDQVIESILSSTKEVETYLKWWKPLKGFI